jgi:hypothetical protein
LFMVSRLSKHEEPMQERRLLLKALYEVYEELVEESAFACAKDCSACCTHNVLATTAEVDLMVDFMTEIHRPDLVAKLLQGTPGQRMQPRTTINGLAAYCLRREEPPESVHDSEVLPCPLRDPEGCPVYPARPFACRSLWSKERCAVGGGAVPDLLLLTLNGVFEQLIEHADVGGLAGNMIDLFAALSDQDLRAAYHARLPLQATDRLLATQPNPGWLVQPAHRPAVMKALSLLDTRVVQGLPFREALKTLRPPQPGWNG